MRDMMDTNVVSVSTTTDQEEVSRLFEKYGFLAIPVVDAEKRLGGHRDHRRRHLHPAGRGQ